MILSDGYYLTSGLEYSHHEIEYMTLEPIHRGTVCVRIGELVEISTENWNHGKEYAYLQLLGAPFPTISPPREWG